MSGTKTFMALMEKAAGAPPPPSNLFPDPDLDGSNTAEWSFSGGFATGGFGGGEISASDPGPSDLAFLDSGGSFGPTLIAATTESDIYTVDLTIESFFSGGTLFVSLRNGTPAPFIVTGNGPVSNNAIAGDGTDLGDGGAFVISGSLDGLQCAITAISVIVM